jgi:hypothetical protein
VSKKAISVTLETDNLTWLKGRAGATDVRSVSELLDRIVAQARAAAPGGAVRSVVGTIDIDPRDPLLDCADAAVRAAFDASLGRPLLVRERSPELGTARRRGRKRRG